MMYNQTLSFIFAIFLLVTTLFWGCSQPQEQPQKPNIVILFADDLGYGDLSTFGHPTKMTPQLDKMAQEGMKLTQFYSTASICSPSRGALLTGRLPVRTGVHTGVYFPNSEKGIPQEEITMAEALKEQGYATACIGKWHLGHREQYLPTNNGFDYYLGVSYSNDMSPPTLSLIGNTEILIKGVDQHGLTRRYTDAARQFIADHQDQPFLLYLPYTFPHVPLYASEQFQDTSSRGLYGDVVQEIDWSVGEVLQTIKDEQLAKNTLVVFTSDNGAWLIKEQNGGSAGLLRDGKMTTWEGGVREPTLAWWPGTIPANTISKSLGMTMDLFTTALHLGGAEIPQDRTIDGKNLMPVLKDPNEEVRDKVLYYKGSSLYAVRKGSWKAHFETVSISYQKDTGKYKSIHEKHDPPLLFNLDHDPSEKYNVADLHPDIVRETHGIGGTTPG